MTNKAVLCGINNYQAITDLRGCINDVHNIFDLLTQVYNFEPSQIHQLIDEQVTKAAIKQEYNWLLNGAQAGDLLVFHFSGHGSYVPHFDSVDEITCLYDMDFYNPETFIRDDEWQVIIQQIPQVVDVTFILDNCHSGTGTRSISVDFPGCHQRLAVDVATSERRSSESTVKALAAIDVRAASSNTATPATTLEPLDRYSYESLVSDRDIILPRFITPPAEFREIIVAIARTRGLKYRTHTLEKHLLLAGCRDDQTAADAYIDGDFHGAFTYYLCQTLRQFPNLGSRETISSVAKLLKVNQFLQIPQHEGTPRFGSILGAQFSASISTHQNMPMPPPRDNTTNSSSQDSTGKKPFQSSPQLLRYPYLECPRSSPIKQLFTIYVKLLIESPKPGTEGILISEPKILIVLRAPSFKIVEPINQEEVSNTKVIEVQRSSDTKVPFFLIPTESGLHEIQVDFIEDGMPIGTVKQHMVITSIQEFTNKKEPEPQPKNLPALDLNNPFPVQQADLELRIQFKKQQQRLVFYLTSTKIDYFYTEIGERELYDSLENIIQSFYKELDTLASDSRKLGSSNSDNSQNSSEVIQDILEETGNRLWRELIPDTLKERYWEFKSSVKSLLIISDEPWIPWEITKPYEFNDGMQEQEPFWCEQFAISRWISGPGVANLSPIEPLNLAIPVAPSNTSLSWAQQEATFVKELNKSCVNVNIKSIPIISRVNDLKNYLKKNQNQFSVLHFACHGMFNTTSPDDSAIKLTDRSLRPSSIYLNFSHKSLRPLVFINACHGARIGFSLTQIGGWAKQFVDAKVAVFIGAMWEVDDEIAYEFATTFYTKLLESENIAIAEAFQQTRQAIREKYPNNSTWLAYSLYAHPEARIIQQAN